MQVVASRPEKGFVLAAHIVSQDFIETISRSEEREKGGGDAVRGQAEVISRIDMFVKKFSDGIEGE